MASRGLQMTLFLVLAAMFWVGAMAQSNSNCNTVLNNLAPCLDFLTGTSTTPSSSCCTQLGAVAKSSPDCLCAALNGSLPTTGIKINRTIALSLPDACQVKSSSLDQCKQAITPPASPPVSPSTTSPSPSSSNTTTPPASGSGSTSTSKSDGGIGRAPLKFVLFLLFVASCASTIATF
ncbi:non-specific lipid transfer protein GPI-anchored 15-like isoform X1 [Mangifera indica]|uniref:non-specific lipid transfer protein GPI-anchored 15-like isoform X1 n=1 Tax=Mangifera indica TaxID=29780 RepID=UPI001CF9C5D1|nr:non-specific lipid transfer protein GPI-anchored 15-like isoform X1 [Mangifera indica]